MKFTFCLYVSLFTNSSFSFQDGDSILDMHTNGMVELVLSNFFLIDSMHKLTMSMTPFGSSRSTLYGSCLSLGKRMSKRRRRRRIERRVKEEEKKKAVQLKEENIYLDKKDERRKGETREGSN